MPVETPILQIDDVLIASIQVALDDRSVSRFEEVLLQRVQDEEATAVVIDISPVDVVDSFMAKSLNDIALGVGLLGADLAIVGIQPAVAISFVQMGLRMPNAITASTLEKGLALVRKKSSQRAADNGMGRRLSPNRRGPVG